jgi:hypothetical protein
MLFYLQAYCKIDGVPTDVLVSGFAAQNRAVSLDWVWFTYSLIDSSLAFCILYIESLQLLIPPSQPFPNTTFNEAVGFWFYNIPIMLSCCMLFLNGGIDMLL